MNYHSYCEECIIESFNPLDKRNLARSVAEAMLQSNAYALSTLEQFEGAGIYALYYTGPFTLYRPVTKLKSRKSPYLPIYVGKAIPAGARKGAFELNAPPGNVMFRRLQEHAKSIAECHNLELRHFQCRFLVVDDIWIPLAESMLIRMFSPLWNLIVDGFGNHDPGSGRYKQQRSAWDTLHPGRKWATKLADASKSKVEIQEAIRQHIGP